MRKTLHQGGIWILNRGRQCPDLLRCIIKNNVHYFAPKIFITIELLKQRGLVENWGRAHAVALRVVLRRTGAGTGRGRGWSWAILCAMAGPIRRSGRISSARPASTTVPGIPFATESAGSCTSTVPPADLIAAAPRNASRPIPVNTTARAAGPKASAALWNKGSAAGLT